MRPIILHRFVVTFLFFFENFNYIVSIINFQIAIPAIPGVRVLVTFTKFEELQPSDEFTTPPSSPTCFQDCKAKEAEGSAGSGYSRARGRPDVQSCESSECRNSRDEADPFLIPSDYSWIDKGRTRRGLKAPEGK